MKSYKIVIIEDEELIREELKTLLVNAGYVVDCVINFAKTIDYIKSAFPDLILLDINLPEQDGYRLCSSIRSFSTTPILFITGRNTTMDELQALTLGGDDYITKPYNPLELLARVKSQLRRYTTLGNMDQKNGNVIQVGSLRLDTDKKELTVDEEAIKLTPIEYKIVELFMNNLGRVFSIDEIYEKVWNEPSFNADNVVAVHIRRIREKIEINPKEPKYLKVVWGIGYKIDKNQ